jgi:hypothetical protein
MRLADSSTLPKAVNEFTITGICPLHQNVFTEEDFLPANLEMVNAKILSQKMN